MKSIVIFLNGIHLHKNSSRINTMTIMKKEKKNNYMTLLLSIFFLLASYFMILAINDMKSMKNALQNIPESQALCIDIQMDVNRISYYIENQDNMSNEQILDYHEIKDSIVGNVKKYRILKNKILEVYHDNKEYMDREIDIDIINYYMTNKQDEKCLKGTDNIFIDTNKK